MKVKELIEILQKADPEAYVVYYAMFQGLEEVKVVQNYADGIGSVGSRMSFEKIKAVELSNGSGEYMKSIGKDILGYVD